MNKRIYVVAALACIFALLAGCQGPAAEQDTPELDVSAGSRSLTYSTNKYPGIYYAWALPTQSVPLARPTTDPLYPGNYMLGMDCLVYLDVLWPTEGAYDWSQIDACLSGAAARNVKLPDGTSVPQPVMLTLPQFMEAGIGDGGRKTVLLLPAWMKAKTGITTTFTSYMGTTYNSIIYKNSAITKDFLDYMIQFMQAAGARYAANPQVAGVRVYVGYQGESQPNRAQGGEDQTWLLNDHEEDVIDCWTYREFVQELSKAAYDAFPGKAVMPMLGVQSCHWPASDWGFRRDAYVDWHAYPGGEIHMGSSINSGAPDRDDADDTPLSTAQPWRKQRLGTTLNSYNNPVGVEWGLNPTGISGENVWQYAYWATLNGMGTGADYVISQWTWAPYMRKEMFQWADAWYASDTATIVARDGEYPGWYRDLNGDSSSGYRGDFTNGRLAVLNEATAFPQSCTASIVATAAVRSAATTPTPWYKPCQSTPMPTPDGGLASTPTTDSQYLQHYANRQGRAIPASSSVYMQMASTWTAHYNQTRNLAVSVTYLDVGADSLVVTVPLAAGGTSSQTITKGGTGIWKTSTVAFTSAKTLNSIPAGGSNAFMRITNGAARAYIHSIKIKFSNASPAPTATPTATRTPTRTPTPKPAATATPSASLQINEVCPNPSADMNLDGSISSEDRAVELINWTASHIDTAGYTLVWNSNAATTFTIKRNSRIYAHNYKAIYAGEDDFDFILPSSGTLQLKNAAGTVVDSVTYPAQSAGYCYARYPNGTSSWATRAASLGYVNP